MSSTNGLTGQYINTLSNLSFEDDTNNTIYLRIDGANTMDNQLDMNNYKIINIQDGKNLQDAVTMNNLTTALMNYILANSPVIFANFNANTFRIINLGAPVNLSDATTVFYVQTLNNLKLSLTGGIMSGAIDMGLNKISNLLSPISGTDGSNKNYVDTAVAQKLNLSGGILSGNIDLNNTARIINCLDPTSALQVCNQQYAIFLANQKLSLNGGAIFGVLNMSSYKITFLGTPTLSTDASTKGYVDTSIASGLSVYLPLAGGVMTGNIDMSTKIITITTLPVNDSDASNKKYIDVADALKLNLSGGTMSGDIAMGTKKITGLGTPTLTTDATTKSYVDTGDSLKLDKTGGTISGNLLCQSFVTIGSTAINTYPLEITSNTSASFASGYAITTAGGAIVLPTLTAGISLKTTNTIWSQTRLIVSSDPRIKTNFQQLDTKESIDIIKKVIPFRYTRIEDNVIELGYSAKNIETLIPEAINKHENKIPSIMEYIECKDGYVLTKKRMEFKEGTEIVLYEDDKEIRTKIIKKLSYNYIRINIPDGHYLFYGHVVSDFLTLDYKQINIHLMKVVQDLLIRVEKLENKLII